ncbi:hypothetical protein HMPREF3088_02790 [Corynebacterium sp. HMSC22B11]|nr:hypothetical protein HMPREF3088_02790 [Corynebacterium sp. HMSC22B11]
MGPGFVAGVFIVGAAGQARLGAFHGTVPTVILARRVRHMVPLLVASQAQGGRRIHDPRGLQPLHTVDGATWLRGLPQQACHLCGRELRAELPDHRSHPTDHGGGETRADERLRRAHHRRAIAHLRDHRATRRVDVRGNSGQPIGGRHPAAVEDGRGGLVARRTPARGGASCTSSGGARRRGASGRSRTTAHDGAAFHSPDGQHPWQGGRERRGPGVALPHISDGSDHQCVVGDELAHRLLQRRGGFAGDHRDVDDLVLGLDLPRLVEGRDQLLDGALHRVGPRGVSEAVDVRAGRGLRGGRGHRGAMQNARIPFPGRPRQGHTGVHHDDGAAMASGQVVWICRCW